MHCFESPANVDNTVGTIGFDPPVVGKAVLKGDDIQAAFRGEVFASPGGG